MTEHLYGETFVPATGAFGHTTTITPYRKPMRTKDGWIMVQPANREQAARFMALGGLEGAYESERFVTAEAPGGKVAVYNEMMAEAAATKTTAEWMALGPQHSIPLMVANDAREVLADPQLTTTLFEERDLPGHGTYRAMRPPLRFARSPATIRREPPEIGADTEAVFAEFGLAD
jgi:crotonobetainyl-CoA:carnitine CoA-transferase CaiB-like acyl-CoA transferase